MDLEEWELLPHDGFLDYHEDQDGENKTTFGSTTKNKNKNKNKNRRMISPTPKSMFDMNYFMCPSSPPKQLQSQSRLLPNQLVPVPIQLEPTVPKQTKPGDHDHTILKDQGITKVPTDLTVVPSVIIPEVIKEAADQDSVSQVFFKKMKENEFVDMKLDSPKTSSCNTKGAFVPPQIDAGAAFNFADQGSYKGDHEVSGTKVSSPRIKSTEKETSTKEEEVIWEENTGGLNLWKLSSTGIGAVCSFGVAAATICIFIFGSHQRNKHNQKLSFQIYTEDKKIKQVVHHATKLNEAIASARGVPIARAHITYGGYYDGL